MTSSPQLKFVFASLLSVFLFKACSAAPVVSYDVKPLVNTIDNTISFVRKDIEKLDVKDINKTVAFVRENFGKPTANVIEKIVAFILNQNKTSDSDDDAKRSGARRRCNNGRNRGRPMVSNPRPVNNANSLNSPINIKLNSVNNNDNKNDNDNENYNENSNENDNKNDNKNKLDNKMTETVVNKEEGGGGGGGGGGGIGEIAGAIGNIAGAVTGIIGLAG